MIVYPVYSLHTHDFKDNGELYLLCGSGPEWMKQDSDRQTDTHTNRQTKRLISSRTKSFLSSYSIGAVLDGHCCSKTINSDSVISLTLYNVNN